MGVGPWSFVNPVLTNSNEFPVDAKTGFGDGGKLLGQIADQLRSLPNFLIGRDKVATNKCFLALLVSRSLPGHDLFACQKNFSATPLFDSKTEEMFFGNS